MLMVDAILVGACVTVSCWATVGLSASVWLWILLWLHHGCSGAMDTFAIASWVEVDVIQFLDMLSTTTIWKGVWRAWQKVGSEESAGGNLKRWRSKEGGHGEKGTRHMKHDVSCKEWSRPFPPPLTLKSKAGFSASLNQRGRKLTFDCYFLYVWLHCVISHWQHSKTILTQDKTKIPKQEMKMANRKKRGADRVIFMSAC